MKINEMVRTAGIEPAQGLPQRIFLPLRFSPPPLRAVCGLDYPFTLAVGALGAARLVSTPSRFVPASLARDCH